MTDKNKFVQAEGPGVEGHKESNKIPSRSELHAHKRNTKTKTKWKVKFPFVRLIGMLFLLIPISILALHFNDKDSNFLDKIFAPPVKNVESISISKNASANTAVVKAKDQGQPSEDKVSTMESEKQETPENEVKGTETSGPGKTNEAKEVTESVNTSTSSETNTQEQSVEQVTEEPANVQYVEHIVQESENLFRISMKYFSSREGEKIISEHNNLVNDQVNVGQKLLIPINR